MVEQMAFNQNQNFCSWKKIRPIKVCVLIFFVTFANIFAASYHTTANLVKHFHPSCELF